jgi:thioredoxin-related protein
MAGKSLKLKKGGAGKTCSMTSPWTLLVLFLVVAFVAFMSYYFIFHFTKPQPMQQILPMPLEMFDEEDNTTCQNTDKPYSLVFFYMDTCPHCVDFKPIWQKFRTSFEGTDKATKVCIGEASANNESFLEKYNVSSFPTVLLIPSNGDSPIPFNSERTVEELQTFIDQNVA